MRDERIDVLRFIGLAMIILAHVGPPGTILQARNFDVPLMLIVAGLSFRTSYKDEPYFTYLLKRIKRLVFPVWLFLSIYFFIILTAGYPVKEISTETIISSYLLLGGIGYVWIIRVFLLVACVSPFVLIYSRRTPSNRKFILTIFTICLVYEFAFSSIKPFLHTTQGYIFEQTVLYLVPYALVFSLGLRLPDLGRYELFRVAATAFIIFAGLGYWLFTSYGRIVPTQEFKYPPQIYYLSYAVFVSVVAWFFSEKLVQLTEKFGIISGVKFVAQNSIWIYLWHIPFIEIFTLPFYLKYPVVFAFATFLTAIQVRLVRQYLLPSLASLSLKKNLNSLLTG